MNARNVGLNDASRASIDAKFASRAVRSLHDAHDLFFAIDKVLLPRAVARVHRGAAEFRKRDDVPDLNLCASSEPSSIPSSVIVVVIVVTVVCSSRFASVSRFIARARRVSHPTARARRSSFFVPVPRRSLSPRSSASASSSRDSPRQSFILCFFVRHRRRCPRARAHSFIHSFIHACIHAFMRASPPTILREPSSSSSTHRLPRHALRQQHPPHGFRRGRDALHQHAVHERSERASSRHPPSSRRRVRRARASRRIESNRIDRWMRAERATTRAPRDAVVRARSIRCDARGRRTRARRSRRGVDRSSDDRDAARDIIIVVARDVVVGTRWMRPR